jgi:GNAT superfamily N-acetyltransferase
LWFLSTLRIRNREITHFLTEKFHGYPLFNDPFKEVMSEARSFVCKQVDFGSAVQQQCILVRDAELRKPLGMSIYNDVPALDTEGSQWHFACVDEGNNDESQQQAPIVSASLILVPNPDEPTHIKLRQMAVPAAFHGQGFGRKLLAFAEDTARAKGFTLIYCNARKTALEFYKKCGWSLVDGVEFLEVGIPHYKMNKKL